jgi:hypothetical protein
MVLGFAGFALTVIYSQTAKTSPIPNPEEEVRYAGQVTDAAANPIYNAEVQIKDDSGNIQDKMTDSVGRFEYYLKPSVKSAHYRVKADGFDSYERDLSPNQTGREAFRLTAVKPTSIPVIKSAVKTLPRTNSKLASTARPCPWQKVLLGQCK